MEPTLSSVQHTQLTHPLACLLLFVSFVQRGCSSIRPPLFQISTSAPFSHAEEGENTEGPLMYQRGLMPCACAHCWCVLCVCCGAPVCACVPFLFSPQRLCPACGLHRPSSKFQRHKTCRDCRSSPPSLSPSSHSHSPLEQVGSNAISLVRSLPVHSHHRGALLPDLAALLSAHATNTESIVFPSIDRTAEAKPDLQPINAIKKKHCFLYEKNLCAAFERTENGAIPYPFEFVPIV